MENCAGIKLDLGDMIMFEGNRVIKKIKKKVFGVQNLTPRRSKPRFSEKLKNKKEVFFL